jgi:hypothetical protein
MVLFAKIPYDLLKGQPPDFIINKSDMTVKMLVETYAGGKIYPGAGIKKQVPPGMPMNKRMMRVLHEVMVDQGPLSGFKDIIESAKGKEDLDPVKMALDLVGVRQSKGGGPPDKPGTAINENIEYVRLREEEMQDEYVRYEIDKKLRDLQNSNRPKDQEAFYKLLYLSKETPQARMDYIQGSTDPYLKELKQKYARRRTSERNAQIAYSQDLL